jgi:hypothetical protein
MVYGLIENVTCIDKIDNNQDVDIRRYDNEKYLKSLVELIKN